MVLVRTVLLGVALLATACAPQPVASYDDPLQQIGRSVSATASQFKTLTLGVVFTDNARKAMKMTRDTQAYLTTAGVFTNQSALEDADPSTLSKAIDEALRRRFKDVVVFNSFEERPAGIDTVMFLDVQITMGTSSGTHTKVAIKGVFVDAAKQPIAQVDGNGDGTVPFPAWTYQFKPAANQAVERFASALDGSTELARRLGAPAALAAAAPAPAAAPRSPQPPLPQPAPIQVAASPALDGKRVALVVGNATYVNVPRLPNTSNDARLVAATLQRLGFTLVDGGPLLDLDRAAFVRAITSFGNQLAGGGVGVFYYAGHGLQMQGENYLVPIDANPTKPSDADIQLVDTNLILHQMEDSGARLKVVILDACRNNPFGGRGLRDASGGLAQMRAPEGTLISYATQPGNVARDGTAGGDSPYTVALTQAMATPGMDVLEMFNQVGVLVDSATTGQQQPWVASSPIKGKFFFAGK